MTHPALTLSAAVTSRALPRWLFVAAAIGVIGVGIDLVQGRPANGLPVPAARVSALAALPQSSDAVANPANDVPMEPGASVAAYAVPADDATTPVPAAAAPQQAEDQALEPGAAVAAYDR